MKNISSSVLILLLSLAVIASGASAESLKRTVDKLEKALLNKDLTTVYKHIALEDIVKAKLKKLASSAKTGGSLWAKSAGKMINFSEPAIAAAALKFINHDYSNSTPARRQAYIDNLKINKVVENGNYGFISATFIGQPAILAAMKNSSGNWVIIGVESSIIDKEFNALLKILRVK